MKENTARFFSNLWHQWLGHMSEKRASIKFVDLVCVGLFPPEKNTGLVYQILTGHPRFRIGSNKCVGACSNNLWSLILQSPLLVFFFGCCCCWWKSPLLLTQEERYEFISWNMYMISFDTLCLYIHGKIGPNLWTRKNPTQTWFFYLKQKQVGLWLDSFFVSQLTQPS